MVDDDDVNGRGRGCARAWRAAVVIAGCVVCAAGVAGGAIGCGGAAASGTETAGADTAGANAAGADGASVGAAGAHGDVEGEGAASGTLSTEGASSGERGREHEQEPLEVYLEPVREMLDGVERGDADALVGAFAPGVRAEVRSRLTAFVREPALAEELGGMFRQLIAEGRLVRADAARARLAVPVRYGPAVNLVAVEGRWYVEDTSETGDEDFPGELSDAE